MIAWPTLLPSAGQPDRTPQNVRVRSAREEGINGVELVAIKELLGHTHIGVMRRCTPTSGSASCATQSTSSDTPSATPPNLPPGPAAATNHPLLQHPSADVAVNYFRQTPERTHRSTIPAGPLHRKSAIGTQPDRAFRISQSDYSRGIRRTPWAPSAVSHSSFS